MRLRASVLRILQVAAVLGVVAPAPAGSRPAPPLFHRAQGPAVGAPKPPVMVGDTFTYDYTTKLTERIDNKPFKELFKGTSTTTVDPFGEKISGHSIQFEFVSEGTDIDNSDTMGTLVDFTGPPNAQREVVWGYGVNADPTAAFNTANAGFSTPYIVDVYPEAGGASWTSSGANLNEYTVQNFGKISYYEDGFVDTRESGEALRDDIYSSSTGATGTNTDDLADGSGRATAIPADHAAMTTTFGLPVQMGSAYFIPVTTAGQTVNVPDWFPGGAQPPQPISSDTFSIAASATTPKDCGPMADMAADDLHETVLTLSVTHGTVSQRSTDYYDTSVGTICRIEHIAIEEYDNTTDGLPKGTVSIETAQHLVSGSLLARRGTGRDGSPAFRSDFTPQEFVPQVFFSPKFLF